MPNASLVEACSRITWLLSDVDGVLTDGLITFDDQGCESKTFHIRDGMGVRLWREAGHRFGIITSRRSILVERRAAEMNADFLRQGADNKLKTIEQMSAELDVDRKAVCYVGDDLLDLRAMRAVGLGVAVADAAEEVRAAADYVTSVPGGRGAIREVVEWILRNTGRWDPSIRTYTNL